jgi:hypothetical protein
MRRRLAPLLRTGRPAGSSPRAKTRQIFADAIKSANMSRLSADSRVAGVHAARLFAMQYAVPGQAGRYLLCAIYGGHRRRRAGPNRPYILPTLTAPGIPLPAEGGTAPDPVSPPSPRPADVTEVTQAPAPPQPTAPAHPVRLPVPVGSGPQSDADAERGRSASGSRARGRPTCARPRDRVIGRVASWARRAWCLASSATTGASASAEPAPKTK